MSQDSEMAYSRMSKTLCECLWKGGVSHRLNSLSLWDFQGPTSQHLFFFLKGAEFFVELPVRLSSLHLCVFWFPYNLTHFRYPRYPTYPVISMQLLVSDARLSKLIDYLRNWLIAKNNRLIVLSYGSFFLHLKSCASKKNFAVNFLNTYLKVW